MKIKAKTLDDLNLKVFKQLIKSGKQIQPTKGCAREKIGVLLVLNNPRARLSHTESRSRIYSCLGELLWYLAGSKDLDFIKYYIPHYDKFTDSEDSVYGAYGPRFFCMDGQNQIDNILKLIKKSNSRKAVIQLFRAEDIEEDRKDVPCTCTLQFLKREGKLHMVTNMRSNDAYIGLPHDLFSFTMVQEILARASGLEIGKYKHFVGSLHIYDKDISNAKQYLDEGWQPTDFVMPSMPEEDPCSQIKKVLKVEEKIRKGYKVCISELDLSPYWADIVRVLQLYAAKHNTKEFKTKFYFDFYNNLFETSKEQ